ncbi:MAG: AhpC/TSA family protein [Nitrospirota bacterium]|jgi:peroxiredoxin|nr:AhpC/TSA family protein [Nitrospirota bacterium]MDH5295552.1 AhpC/TSA family protein [Nitrospirota bacterium]
MGTKKFSSGSRLPPITLPLVGGGTVTLGQPQKKGNWQLVFVYRGLHCPICKKYLKKLESLKDKFLNTGAEIVAVSGDPETKAASMVEPAGLTFPVAYGLSIGQMKDLGLYISHPRSPEETDRPFPEPGMFAVNADGHVQLIDISNTPFNRSDLDELVETVKWIQENNYPIRGTYE